MGLELAEHNCGHFRPLSKGKFRQKMTTIIGNRGQLWTSTFKPPFAKPPFRLSRRIEACLMRTNISSKTIALSKLYCRGVAHERKAFLDDFPLPPIPSPHKNANLVLIIVSAVSERRQRTEDYFGGGRGSLKLVHKHGRPGCPKFADPTPTDPISHSLPSDCIAQKY